ncbi:MAG: nucleotidyltransferase family protein [Bacteroidales bacterium]|nr:nucleotidyltransferase family protein [Bacteroidales bacterium]
MSTHTLSMIQIIAEYFKTQPVLKAWIFGSFARGEEKPWSDMDILVQYDRTQPIGLLKIAGMQVDLEDLLGLEVDLVEEGTLRPWAVESVNNDKQLIYERA